MNNIKYRYLAVTLLVGALVPTTIFGAYKYSPQIASFFSQKKVDVESEVAIATTTASIMSTSTIDIEATSSSNSSSPSSKKKAEAPVTAKVQTQIIVPQVTTSVQIPAASQIDYRSQLVAVYQTKINLLKKANASVVFRQVVLEQDVRDNNDFIAGSEAYQLAYSNDSDLVALAEVGIKLKKLQNTEDQKYITTLKEASVQIKSDQAELESTMSVVSSNPVSLEQANLNAEELNSLNTEANLESLGERMTEIGDYISLRNTKIDAFIKFNATKFRDSLGSVSVQAVVNTPAPQPIVSPYGKINCTTSNFLNDIVTKCTTGPAY